MAKKKKKPLHDFVVGDKVSAAGDGWQDETANTEGAIAAVIGDNVVVRWSDDSLELIPGDMRDITELRKVRSALDEGLVKAVLKTVDAGLCAGKGSPIPGKMCVEAAVCYAMGLPHSDRPTCVAEEARDVKIALNDAQGWPSDRARAAGLRELAVAQLGSNKGKVGERFEREMARLLWTYNLPLIKQWMKANDIKKMPKGSPSTVADRLLGLLEGSPYDDMAPRYRIANNLVAAWAGGDIMIEPIIHATPASKRHKALKDIAALAVKTLKKAKSPGCKFLYLCKKK